MLTLPRTARGLLGLASVLLTAMASAVPRHVVLSRQAAQAAQAGDLAAALACAQEVATLRPDWPRVQLTLARLHTAQGETAPALAALGRLADMGVALDVAADPRFAALKDVPGFTALAARLSAGPVVPATDGPRVLAVPGVTGILESCLVDPLTGAWYFGDVRHRCIWKCDPAAGPARLVKFSDDADALDGVFKLLLTADRRTLWAATATVGAMAGPDAEDGKRSQLVAIDFPTGRVRQRCRLPDDGRKHLLGDTVFIRAVDPGS